jgi:creatinine amidohydrolase/Fe(II)-dependent formamide hydrolase-like protein
MNSPVIPEFAEGWVKFSRPWKAFAPSSGAGDPTQATAVAGAKVLAAAVVRIGNFLLKLSKAPRNSGFPYGE